MNKLATFIIVLLILGAAYAVQAQLVHPGMLNSKAELDFIKRKIKAGAEPWASSFKLLQSDNHAKSDWQPKPMADVIRGSYNNPNIGAGDLGNDSQVAYIQALEWTLTGKKQYAEKAIEILNAWSYALKSISGSDMQLLAGITGYKFCNAAEIIRHTSKLWNEKDQLQFEQMLKTVYYPLVRNYKPQANGNWDASMIATTMCIGIFLDDTAMYNGAVAYTKNGHSNGAIPNYIGKSGQCQESGRDQQHTQLGLGYLADLCEIAWKQGDDLYGAFDNRVALGFEYTARYNLGEEVEYQPVPDLFGKNLHPVISEKGRGNFRPVYEIIYHHYHDRMGLEMKYTKLVLDKIRPEGFHWDHSSFGTLLHSQLPVFKEPNYPADLSQLHQNVVNELLNGPLGTDILQDLLNRMNDQGAWPNIDYTSKQRGSWEPTLHLSYVQTMAKAWKKPGSNFYNNPILLAKIHLALNYWLDNDFQCPNWWYPEIGVPMQLAPILILMEDQLSPEQMAKGIKILDRSKIGMTGQNKVWQSGNVLLKSVLQRNSDMIRKAANAIQEEMKVSLGEGIQPDGSFHQHGPQIQFGNYGLAYVGDMIKWIRLLRNTPYYFDESKMSILRNYLIDGQQWITWKNQMDISACGRQLFLNAQTGKARSLARNFSQMETLDPENGNTYKKANQYENLIGNKHFWRSDFQVKRTPDYYFSVKMCSERVIGAESCNSENLQGYYMGDGATYLYQSGKEYENIFPYWDWKKIPGTTIQQDDKELPVLTASGYRIKSDFVGGVSDGKNGVAVMDYNRNGLSAKKTWFIFNDQIVCLGAGIIAESGIPVTTSVNQSFLNGEVIVKSKTEKTFPAESSETITPKWILHDQAGYYFPEGGNLKLETKTVTGSWHAVAAMYKDEPIKSGIFKLWFEHGPNPSDQSYAYVVVPKATKAKMQQLEIKPSFRIVENEHNIQAVISSDQNWGGIVFYQAGKTELFGGIETDQPAVLMVKKEKNGLSVSVSDPTQKLNQILLTLKGNYQSENPACSVSSSQGNSILTVSLPKGDEAGKTVLMELIKK